MAVSKDKLLERASNIAVVVVALVVLVSFVRHEFFPSNDLNRSFKGKTLQLASITQSPAKLNVILGISTTCHFCEQNVDFYKKLSGLEVPGKIEFFTIFPQPITEANSYLIQQGIHPDGVISSPLSRYDIVGTPTLLLVNARGKVEEAWTGALDTTRQAEVVNKIRRND